MNYTYVWALHIERANVAPTFMLYSTERKAKKSAKAFDPAKGWTTRIEMLVLN